MWRWPFLTTFGILPLAGLATGLLQAAPAIADQTAAKAVLETYADIAHAVYDDSLEHAKGLKAAVDLLIESPTEKTLGAARQAWLNARVPYQQSEVFRFGNPLVDEWEGKVNAWPLDEGLIDYVDADYYGAESDENDLYTVNVIANPILKIDGKEVDASRITPDLLATKLHEAGGVEGNVATGYHAIEFLLWGQDLNFTGPGAGDRPASDYDIGNCSNGNCDRRAAYLKAAVQLLVTDLSYMRDAWKPGGDARNDLMNRSADQGLARILLGMGSLTFGELAGERMKLGLLLHDPEEEHDCFSDNTHNSHYYDAQGIQNVFLGRYRRTDGSVVGGPSLSALVAASDSRTNDELIAKLEKTQAAMAAIVDRAVAGEAYDQLIREKNTAGNRLVQNAIDALVDQFRSIERVVAVLGLGRLKHERSDSLDNPNAVFK